MCNSVLKLCDWLKLQIKLTWWVRAISFVALISAVVIVVASAFVANALSNITSKLVTGTSYKAIKYDKHHFSLP